MKKVLLLLLLLPISICAQTVRPTFLSQIQWTELTTAQEAGMTLAEGSFWYNTTLNCYRYRSATSTYCIGGEEANPSVLNNVRKCDGARFSNADAAIRLRACIDDAPTAGIADDRGSTGTQTFSTSLTIPKSIVLLGSSDATYVLGTNQIIIGAGTSGVAIVFPIPWGKGGGGGLLTYTGTGTAILIGGSGSVTQNTLFQDFNLDITGAGTAAIGIEAIRTQFFDLIRPRIQGLTSASTQILFKSDGAGGFSSFTRIIHPWFSNGNIGARFTGPSAATNNANQIRGGAIPGVPTGTGVYFDQGDTNVIDGTDISGWAIGVRFGANSVANSFPYVRTEGNTTDYQFDASSANNYVFTTDTGAVVVDNGSNNHLWIATKGLRVIPSSGDVEVFTQLGIGEAASEPLRVQSTPNADRGSIHIRPASGNLVYITLTEDGVADRGSMGFDAGSAEWQFIMGGISGTKAMGLSSGGVLEPKIGMKADGGGFKHIRGVTSCATAATVGANCDSTVTWVTAFPNANYSVRCQGAGVTSGVPVQGSTHTKLAGSVKFQTIAVTAAAAQFVTIECFAVHD